MRGEVLEWGSIVFLGAKTSIVKSALVEVLVLLTNNVIIDLANRKTTKETNESKSN